MIHRAYRSSKNSKNRTAEDGDTSGGSGVDTQTSETRESDDYYANLKKLDIAEKAILPPLQWLNDKSDLDSLDSNYFKNSAHQPNFVDVTDHVIVNREHQSEVNVLEIQVYDQSSEQQTHQQQTTNAVSTTTVSTNSDHCSVSHNDDSTLSVRNLSSYDEIVLSSEKDSDVSLTDSCDQSYNNTLTLSRHKISVSEYGTATYEKRSKFKEDRKSVVSYDSIYLSSEGSSEQTLADDNGEDPLPEIRVDVNGEFIDNGGIIETQAKEITTVECLYSEIKKTKPKVIGTESKSNLTSFSDTSTRGTLERLTIISTPAQQKEFQRIEGKLFSTEPFVGTLIDNQYCSLPDAANIGISLRASEHIDAKLRQSCNVIEVASDEAQNPIYDSISRFGRAHKRLRQRESFEIVVLNPISIDESTSIETIDTDTNRCKSVDTQKSIEAEKSSEEIEESAERIERDRKELMCREAYKQTVTDRNTTTVCLGKKAVIVDELAAKVHRNLALFESHKTVKNETAATVKNATTKTVAEIQIIVTDAQNNVIDCSEPNTNEQGEKSVVEQRERVEVPAIKKEKSPVKRQQTVTVKPPPVPPPLPPPPPKPSTDSCADKKHTLRDDFRANLTDTLRKRIAQSRSTFSAKPVRVYSCENIEKLDATYEIHPSLTYKVKIKDKPDTKMSRPQILNVIDTKRNVCSVAPQRQNVTAIRQSFIEQAAHDQKAMAPKRTSRQKSVEPKQEFQDKVDSIRCYWSKLTKDVDEAIDKVDFVNCDVMRRPSSATDAPTLIDDEVLLKNHKNERKSCISNSTRELRMNMREASRQHMTQPPTVEIVELDGHKQAAIVNAQHATDSDFDHVRYKVMRSETFQKNMMAQQTRKEAQFDGLLQYLHNYSFQVRNSSVFFCCWI